MATLFDARLMSCTSGATAGAALGAFSGGRNVVVGAAVGAALGSVIGAACGAALENWKAAAPRNLKPVDEVASGDAAAIDEEVDYAKEANVLRAFFIGQREVLLQSACESENAVDRLEAAREQFQPWATATPEQIGRVIQSVVEALGAPHLRPTSIAQQLDGRVAGACFAVFKLVSHEAFDVE